MRRTLYLRIVDEVQGGEVELRSLILLFLFPVRLFDVLQILFPLPRLLIGSAVLHRSQIKGRIISQKDYIQSSQKWSL